MSKEDHYLEEMKIERKVFDRRTLLAIYKLMNKEAIKTVESLVKEGKESLVAFAKNKRGEWLAVKIYKTEYTDFKSRWKYLAGDPRFSSVRKNKIAVTLTWARREFKNLNNAFSAGVSCPKTMDLKENVLVMSFIGEDGIPAPRLSDVVLKDPEMEYEFVLGEMEKLSKNNIIHTDLSAFNILFFDKPYLIDFSQSVTSVHPLAGEFLMKDIRNVNVYFEKQGVQIRNEKELFQQFSKNLEI